jgi:hypothetical protein
MQTLVWLETEGVDKFLQYDRFMLVTTVWMVTLFLNSYARYYLLTPLQEGTAFLLVGGLLQRP